ncbi:hypothetical protein DFH06DRAFT_1348528 [Mycena polygramma]|nr:hypothetical protein DFH06DRAFT_1348528 [Mycena polygramma]
MSSASTLSLRSGDKPRESPKQKPHTDLYNPVPYAPRKPRPGHEACTFDLYPHDRFRGLKFHDHDDRTRFFTAAKGRDGPVAIYTESTAAYTAQRTAEEGHAYKDRESLDMYLGGRFCKYKEAPCKLAGAAGSSNNDVQINANARAGPSTAQIHANALAGPSRPPCSLTGRTPAGATLGGGASKDTLASHLSLAIGDDPYVPEARDITDAEDLAVKREAIQSALAGTPPDPVLQRWLDRYIPPKSVPKPAGYVPGAANLAAQQALEEASKNDRPVDLVYQRYLDRFILPKSTTPKPPGYVPGAQVRARVAARKARVDNVVAMRRAGSGQRCIIFHWGEPYVPKAKQLEEAKAARARARETREALALRAAKDLTIARMMEARLINIAYGCGDEPLYSSTKATNTVHAVGRDVAISKTRLTDSTFPAATRSDAPEILVSALSQSPAVAGHPTGSHGY